MCRDLKLKSVRGPSLKANRKVLREARGMSPKPGRRRESRDHKKLPVPVQEQEDTRA